MPGVKAQVLLGLAQPQRQWLALNGQPLPLKAGGEDMHSITRMSSVVTVEGEGLEARVLAEAFVVRRDGRVGRMLHGRHAPAVHREPDKDVGEGEFVAGDVGICAHKLLFQQAHLFVPACTPAASRCGSWCSGLLRTSAWNA